MFPVLLSVFSHDLSYLCSSEHHPFLILSTLCTISPVIIYCTHYFLTDYLLNTKYCKFSKYSYCHSHVIHLLTTSSLTPLTSLVMFLFWNTIFYPSLKFYPFLSFLHFFILSINSIFTVHYRHSSNTSFYSTYQGRQWYITYTVTQKWSFWNFTGTSTGITWLITFSPCLLHTKLQLWVQVIYVKSVITFYKSTVPIFSFQ